MFEAEVKALVLLHVPYAGLVEGEVFAEVHPPRFFVRDDFGRAAFGDDGAVGEDVGAVAAFQGFAHVVVGDEYADAAVGEVGDDVSDVADGDGVHAGKGFV